MNLQDTNYVDSNFDGFISFRFLALVIPDYTLEVQSESQLSQPTDDTTGKEVLHKTRSEPSKEITGKNTNDHNAEDFKQSCTDNLSYL